MFLLPLLKLLIVIELIKKLINMSSRILLPNGATMTRPSVNPNNWKTGGLFLLESNWRIQYYYYPQIGKRKLVVVKGMNTLKSLSERRLVTKALIEDEIESNKAGYNPITKKYEKEVDEEAELNPNLHFITAFRIASTKIQCSIKHRKEVNWCIDRLETKVAKFRLSNVVIDQLTRKQLKQLLESCELPDSYYNKYLSFLSRLFNELLEYECCPYNIVRDIRKRKLVQTKRETLTHEQHKSVMGYLKSNHYEFWRYARIFLFSGARTTELFRVQVKDVDIVNQEYNTVILKGVNPQEVTKVILKEVMPIWEELIKDANPTDYVFSRGLRAGANPIQAYQITRRWLRLVKNSDDIKDRRGNIIKVTADFYSLKHSLLDALPEDVAMKIASHTNSKTTSIYRVNSEKRNLEELKNLKLDENMF